MTPEDFVRKYNDISKVDFNSALLYVKKRVNLTRSELESFSSNKGGWTRQTLTAFGVPYPPQKGWKEAILKFGVPLINYPELRHYQPRKK